MKVLRRLPTPRLLLLCAVVVVVLVGGSAIAVAALSGSGPKPAPKPLARAVRDALRAPVPTGVTARIQFTNHLVDSSAVQGNDPLLSGASGRLWATRDHLRLELQATEGQDAQLVVDHRRFWAYDGSSNTVYEGTLPAPAAGGDRHAGARKHADSSHGLPSLAEIQRKISEIRRDATLSGAIPSDVAGHPTYTVRVGPKRDGGLLSAGEAAFDAARGVPLRLAVYARGTSGPVLALQATDVSFGPVPTSDFAVTPPRGAKVVHVSMSGGRDRTGGRAHARQRPVTGVRAVQAHLPFHLSAPATLAGRARSGARLLDWSGHPAALVTYGYGLGAIAVVERQPGAGHKQPAPTGSSDHHGAGLSLPTVSIGGVTATELPTALGTGISFERAGVSYTVVGSVPRAAAEAAARGL